MRPAGLLFPGDPGVPDGIAPVYWKGIHAARWHWPGTPPAHGNMSVRAAYGIFYDSFTNGVGGPLQAPLSALPWTQARQLGPPMNFTNPWNGAESFALDSFPQPTTVLTVENGMRPAIRAELEPLHAAIAFGKLSAGRSLHRQQRDPAAANDRGAIPRCTGRAPLPDNADQRRLYAGCHGAQRAVRFRLGGADHEFHQFHLSRRRRCRFLAAIRDRLGFPVLLHVSKSLDYVSSFNVSGSAPRLVAGENDLAQNPFDLKAEHGPSLFDARHRFVLQRQL